MKRYPSTSSWIVCALLLLSGCGGMSRDMMAPSLRIATQNAPAGATTVQYNGKNGLTLAATGGTPPYKWSWAPAPNSDLPPGLRLNGASISGTPEASGEFRVVVTVTDSGHPAAQTSVAYTVAVDAPLAITSGMPPSGTVGIGYGAIGTIYLKCVWSSTGGVHQVCTRCDPAIAGSCPANRTNCSYPNACTKTVRGHTGFQFTATGGAAPYTWTGTGLPYGLGLYPKFGIMSGTPNGAGPYKITVTVKDSEPTPQQIEAKYSVTIAPPPPPKLTLDGYCFGAAAGLPPNHSCRIVQDLVHCPVGTPAITPETVDACLPPVSALVDASTACAGSSDGHAVRGNCTLTYSSATAMPAAAH